MFKQHWIYERQYLRKQNLRLRETIEFVSAKADRLIQGAQEVAPLKLRLCSVNSLNFSRVLTRPQAILKSYPVHKIIPNLNTPPFIYIPQS